MAGVIIPKLHGRFSITTSSDNFTINEAGAGARIVNLDETRDWFIRQYTGEVTAQFVDHIQTQTRAAGPGVELDTFTCTVSDTGFVTFAGSGGNFTVTWTETVLRDLLGFTGDLAGAATYTATNQHRFGWYPNTGVSAIMAHPNRVGLSTSDAVTRRAPSGRVITTAYDEYVDNKFTWRWIEDEYMFPVGLGGTTITNRDFETFWRDVIRIGQRFRFYPNRTIQTASPSGAPWEYVGDADITQGGTGEASEEQDNFSRYWRFVMGVHEFAV